MLEFLNQLYPLVDKHQSLDTPDSVFVTGSSYFYHENFHSDLLAYYLRHELAKQCLIEWLNQANPTLSLSPETYRKGKVLRESKRIDITLKSRDGSRAIIIENKSNEAGDQDRQLYRYYQSLKNQGIEVDCILYLNKHSLKPPYLADLSSDEKKLIENKLIIAQLIGESGITENVLHQVLIKTPDIRLNALTQELTGLFEHTIYGEMNLDTMREFVEALRKEDNRAKLDKVIASYYELPRYLAQHYKPILEQKHSDYRLSIYLNEIVVIDGLLQNGPKHYAIDFIFNVDKVDISILAKEGPSGIKIYAESGAQEEVEKLKAAMGDSFPFKEIVNNRYRVFIEDIFDEERIITTVDEIVAKFRAFTPISTDNESTEYP